MALIGKNWVKVRLGLGFLSKLEGSQTPQILLRLKEITAKFGLLAV